MEMEYKTIAKKLWECSFYRNNTYDKPRAHLDLLFSAHHKGKNEINKKTQKPVYVGRGETWVSKHFLAERWHWDRKKVSSFFTELENNNFIKIKPVGSNARYGYIITIINYDKMVYDGVLEIKFDDQIVTKNEFFDEETEQIENNVETRTKHEENTNKTTRKHGENMPRTEKGGVFPPNKSNKDKNSKDSKEYKKNKKKTAFIFPSEKTNQQEPLQEEKKEEYTEDEIYNLFN